MCFWVRNLNRRVRQNMHRKLWSTEIRLMKWLGLLMVVLSFSLVIIGLSKKRANNLNHVHYSVPKKITLNLPKEVILFNKICRQNNITVVLVEPCVLWRTLTDEEQQLQIRRKFVLREDYDYQCSSEDQIFSFFLAEEHKKLFGVNSKLIEELDDNDFKIYLQKGEKYDLHSHMFIQSNDLVIPVAVYYEKTNYVLIRSAGHFTNIAGNLRYGQYDQAFHKFKVQDILTQGNLISIVEDVPYFLMQRKFSRFIDCDRDRAQKLRRNIFMELFDIDAVIRMKSLLDDSFQLIDDIQRKLLIPLCLDGGTLLAWNRHCAPLPHDHDVDLVTFLAYNEDSYNLTRSIKRLTKSPWSLFEMFGFPWNGLQLRMWNIKAKWGVDIFFADWNEQDMVYLSGYHPYPSSRYCLLDYPKEAFDEMCSSEFNGLKVFVPCKPEVVHRAEYGDDWVKPNETFAINNGRHCMRFTKEEVPLAYQCLGLNRIQEAARVNGSAMDRQTAVIPEYVTLLAEQYFRLCQKMKKRKLDVI